MRRTFFLIFFAFAASFCCAAWTEVKDSLEYGRGVYVSPDYLLQGQVSGLRVGSVDGNVAGAITTSVRGMNSVFSTSNPLWIVDGAIISDCTCQIQDAFDSETYGKYNYNAKASVLDILNLYDIESIEVLKDVSETAIYGSRGANGVIVVKTKKGTAEKPFTTWHSNVGIPTKGGVSNSHDLSVNTTIKRTGFRASAFYRDINGGFRGAGFDRAGGVSLSFDACSNKILWFGFSTNASIARQTLQTAAANYGVPTMGLALSGIVIPGVKNSTDGWINDYDDYSKAVRANGSIYLQLNFLPWLRWRTEATYDINNSTRYFWYGLGTAFGEEFNRAASIDIESLFGYNIKTSLSAERYFAEINKVSANIFASVDGSVNRFNNMSGDHFFTDALREKGFSLRESASMPHHISKDYYNVGFGALLSYSFGSYFGVDALYRADRMYRYEDSYVSYPAANAWVDFREIFFRNSDAVSVLKLKGGWGRAGSHKYIPYSLLDRVFDTNLLSAALNEKEIEIDPSDTRKSIMAYFDGFNHSISSEFNVGFESSFLKNRLGFNMTFFSKNTKEIFDVFSFGCLADGSEYVWKPADKWLLVSDSRAFTNKGIEGELIGRIISTNIVKWNANLNIATCSSDMTVDLSKSIEGFNPFPKLYGGFGTDLNVVGLTFEALFTGASGFDIYNMNAMLSNKATEFSKDYVEKGDYLRLSRASLGYDINVDKVKWIKSLRVSLTGTNLLTFTKYTGVNPDVNSFGNVSNNSAGLDYGTLPLVRTVMLGIKAEF